MAVTNIGFLQPIIEGAGEGLSAAGCCLRGWLLCWTNMAQASVYNNRMKSDSPLALAPHLSRLADSLCFELAVNVPDDSSLSLLEILQMRQNADITFEEFVELYRSWLEAKNVFDLFTAKQVRIFSKTDLLATPAAAPHLHPDTLTASLQLLHDLYDHLYEQRRSADRRLLQQTEDLFSYLDSRGVIHLRLSELFFLQAAASLSENGSLPQGYEGFKAVFKLKNRELCEVEGMVCLRWFKNYFLFQNGRQVQPRVLLEVLKDIEKGIRSATKRDPGLPNVMEQAFMRWRGSARFSGLFEAKKKKADVYLRVFEENQYIFFFNGGKEDPLLSEHYFIKKYGEDYVKSLKIDAKMLREFAEQLETVLGEYLQLIARTCSRGNSRHQKSGHSTASVPYQLPSTPSHHTTLNHSSNTPIHQISTTPTHYNTSHKKTPSNAFQSIKQPLKLQARKSIKDKTPTKINKGNDTKRINITPTNRNTRNLPTPTPRNTKLSPYAQQHFASTEKQLSKKKLQTPIKTHVNPSPSLYTPTTTQIYKCSQKEGLGGNSFYEKLFFFRNKRVESYDIVMRRLKGK